MPKIDPQALYTVVANLIALVVGLGLVSLSPDNSELILVLVASVITMITGASVNKAVNRFPPPQ